MTALDSVDLELFPGELVVAAGPSGSGKTTLLSILAGIDEPDTGTVRLLPPLPADTPVADLPWSDLAFVPQSPTLLDELTVAENIDLPARLAAGRNGRPRRAHRTRDDARSNESGRGGASGGYRRRSGADGETLLDLGERGPRPDGRALLPGEFGAGASVSGTAALDDRFDGAGQAGGYTTAQLLADLEIGQLADRYPSQTSGGEQQRTAIGRALRLRPRILLADEPTGHQDRARVGLVLDILRRHAYAGYTVLISSHNADMIHVADRVVTLADGRIVTDSYHRVGRP